MSQLNNLKISLRTDTIANWTKYNPILKKGEIAIVINESGNEQLKFGNGISSFIELKYFNQEEVKTEKIDTTELKSKSIAQGYNVKATPTSLATGIFTEADGNFGVVHGIEAKIKEGDDYAFVFNGENLPGITDRYVSHGEGTFNINPLSGLSGFYIGEQSLQSIIDAYVDQLSNEISGKIQYGDYGKQLSSLNTLSIVTIKDDDYYELVKKGKVDPTVFYNVSSLNLNAYSQRVLNVADPVANMDAANKVYVDNVVSEVKNSSDNKIKKGNYNETLTNLNTLSIVNIDDANYHDLVVRRKLNPDVLYIVSADIINSYGKRIIHTADPTLSDDVATKNYVDNLNGPITEICIALSNKIQLGDYNEQLSSVDSLSIVHIDSNTYYELAIKKELDPTVLYIVSSDYINAYKRNIRYVAEPILSDDAATKNYVDSISDNISVITKETVSAILSVKLDRSEFADVSSTFLTAHQDISGKLNREEFSDVSSNFLTAHQSLSDYYKKNETSSSSEIEYAISTLSADLSDCISSVSVEVGTLNTKIDTVSSDLNTVSTAISTAISADITSIISVIQSISSLVSTDLTALVNNITQISTGLSTLEISSAAIDNKVDNKVKVGINDQELSAVDELSIVYIDPDSYYQKVAAEQIDGHVLYIVSSDQLNAHELTIKEVATPVLSSDAANKAYVDMISASISGGIDPEISAEIKEKIKIGNYNDELSNIRSLSIIKISEQDYIDLIAEGKENRDAVYVISSECINAYDKRIVNVATPIISSDAATKTYVDNSANNLCTYANSISSYVDVISSYADSISAATGVVCYELSTNVVPALSDAIKNKVKIGINNQELSTAEELSIIYIDPDSYYQKVAMEQIDDSVLYIVSADQLNAHELTIKEVATPVLSSDAANKAYIDNIYSTFNAVITQLQNKISQMEQKLSALPFTDSNGRFYMPDGINTTTGNTEYRMLSAYVEESGGALIATSDNKYIRVNDQFIEVNI